MESMTNRNTIKKDTTTTNTMNVLDTLDTVVEGSTFNAGIVTHVFIVSSKGIPAKYGGFETFVENLTARKQNKRIKYHVSCMVGKNDEEKRYKYNGADCFQVRVPMDSATGRILHVSRVLRYVEKWSKKNRLSYPDDKIVILILGCRIGPLLIPHSIVLHCLGVRILCNPDGLEWKRSKWSTTERLFLKLCERCLIRCSDFIICDSKHIEKYIREKYKIINTTFIPYGADVKSSTCDDEAFTAWASGHGVKSKQYFLIVGRFVPENNYETMLREFAKSNTDKDLIIITNIEKNKFYEKLKCSTHFDTDPRIKFVGTVYNTELLKKIREESYAYIHGHECGGTNPSLLEAMASTEINLLYDVEFNREVGGDAAIYWSKKEGSLSIAISFVEGYDLPQRIDMDKRGTDRIRNIYDWKMVTDGYESVIMNETE